MNVFIILSILVIILGIILLVTNTTVLFKLNWNEKTGIKILGYLQELISIHLIHSY